MTLLAITIVFILLSYGLSNMVVFASGPFNIFRIIRKTFAKINKGLGEMVSCMICFPTWVGMGLSFINLFLFPTIYLTPFNIIFFDLSHAETSMVAYVSCILFDGALASGTTWFIHNVEEFFELRK